MTVSIFLNTKGRSGRKLRKENYVFVASKNIPPGERFAGIPFHRLAAIRQFASNQAYPGSEIGWAEKGWYRLSPGAKKLQSSSGRLRSVTSGDVIVLETKGQKATFMVDGAGFRPLAETDTSWEPSPIKLSGRNITIDV